MGKDGVIERVREKEWERGREKACERGGVCVGECGGGRERQRDRDSSICVRKQETTTLKSLITKS